ncbi:MAG: glycosyltransferase family 4 protein [Paludibacter sp.]|nr:glycosyltransferase family 4 protein [Paludibacter sp.]
MITKNRINKDLCLIKKKAIESSAKFHYTESIKLLELFAKLSYNYNIKYADDEVEMLIEDFSKKKLGEYVIEKNNNKIIFYDSFSIDNKGLTQQYLRAIFSWKTELLYITNNIVGSDIQAELDGYSLAKIITYDRYDINKFKEVINEIIEFKPEKVILHFSPWDISGISIWNTIKNVDKFLVNLTDHAFWLGKTCADYVLEFRNYGSYLSVNQRNIALEKLLMQPYYPIINIEKFRGFPFLKNNKIIAFAGSNLYKIAGKNNLFLDLIKEILQQNKKLIFVLAGSGDQKKIQNFINDNKLNDKFYLIGNRKDINSVIENIDIYVNTYPMIGGLMSQYAAILDKPIIGYTSPDLYGFNDVEDLLRVPQKGFLVRNDINDFLDYFNQLINNNDTRVENVNYTIGCVLTPENFSSILFKNIYKYEGKINLESFANIKFDSKAIEDLYIEMENSNLKNHYNTIVSTLKIISFKYFPIETTKHYIFKLSKKVLLAFRFVINH